MVEVRIKPYYDTNIINPLDNLQGCIYVMLQNVCMFHVVSLS